MTFPNGWREPWRLRGWRGAISTVRCAVALAGGLAAALLCASPAAAAGKNAVLVVDGNSGQTLYASAADELRYPASLTKMMTLYMVFEQIERGRLSYQSKIRISATATAAAPSKLDLKEGEEIALIDAIRVLITKSANDVAIAVAEHIGGTEEKFARMMTAKAHQIGMAHTTFRNASGLPDAQQVTTARDMATLALRLQDEFPQHYALFGTRTVSYRGETFNTHNTLLLQYEGTDGIKTGYTRASGFNLVSSVRRGKKHVIGVIFGGASAASRNRAMRTFLNIGLVKASTEKTRKSSTLVATAPRTDAPARIAAVPVPQRIAARPQPDAAPAALAPSNVALVRVRPMPVAPRKPAPPETASINDLLKSASDRTPAPALAPSTLEQQAQRLSRAEPVTAPWTTELRPGPRTANAKATVKAPPVQTVAATPAASAARFQVQIGAFPSAAEAERQLAAVRARAPVLGQAKPLTQPVQQGEKTLYRARYAGLESNAANQACEELKKQGVACMVFKAD